MHRVLNTIKNIKLIPLLKDKIKTIYTKPKVFFVVAGTIFLLTPSQCKYKSISYCENIKEKSIYFTKDNKPVLASIENIKKFNEMSEKERIDIIKIFPSSIQYLDNQIYNEIKIALSIKREHFKINEIYKFIKNPTLEYFVLAHPENCFLYESGEPLKKKLLSFLKTDDDCLSLILLNPRLSKYIPEERKIHEKLMYITKDKKPVFASIENLTKFNAMSEKERMDIIKTFPENIKYIDNPSENEIKIRSDDGNSTPVYKFIKNPTLEHFVFAYPTSYLWYKEGIPLRKELLTFLKKDADYMDLVNLNLDLAEFIPKEKMTFELLTVIVEKTVKRYTVACDDGVTCIQGKRIKNYLNSCNGGENGKMLYDNYIHNNYANVRLYDHTPSIYD